jgi:hypothetical protein
MDVAQRLLARPSAQSSTPPSVTSFPHGCIGVPPNTMDQQFLKTFQDGSGADLLFVSRFSKQPPSRSRLFLFLSRILSHLH